MSEAPRAAARPVIRWALLVFLIAATVGFIALGVWQVERLQWKRDLIARVDARVHATPAPVQASSFRSALDPAEDEYRRVTATGRLLLHVLDLVDEETWVRLIKDRYERRLMEIFE